MGAGAFSAEVGMGSQRRYIQLVILGEEGYRLEGFGMAGRCIRIGTVTAYTPVVAATDAIRRFFAEVLQSKRPGQLANNCERTTIVASQS